METLNFIFTNNNKEEVDNYLKSVNYLKIGHTENDIKGYCIMINKKKYFEISSAENPNITKSENISDVKFYCL